jgi:hypothetical protein
MHRTAYLGLAALLLIGCAPSASQQAAGSPPASVQGPPIARADLEDAGRSGGPPQLPWPAFQAGSASSANQAELAIVWRSHELREKHPGATPAEVAQLLARDTVWEQNAKLIPPPRRTMVAREALVLW